MTNQLNKTISRADLKLPEVATAAGQLAKFGHRLWFKGVPFAVNGVLKRRWRIRWNKQWEYARGLAYGDFQPGSRVLDLGGGGTIPLFYLANRGCEVLSLDINPALTAHTNAVAKQLDLPLTGSTHDLTDQPAPAAWGRFDRIISFCVIEHIPKALQRVALLRLAELLKPGGCFALTFDYGANAPVEGAIRTVAEVRELVNATGLALMGDGEFHETGEQFVLDNKYPGHQFTFGAIFLTRPRN